MTAGHTDDPVAPPGPVFIGGVSRSGKTLLRWILSSHGGYAVSRRTEMWPRYAGRFGDLARDEELARCLDTMLARRQIAAMEIDRVRLVNDFSDGPSTYARLFALMHKQLADRLRTPIWGDQSEGIERFADEVIAAHGGARIVHMMRDPRDRYAAIRERSSSGVATLPRSTAEWLTSAALASRHVHRHPTSYRVLRYEDLVERPEATTRALCDFLGVPFEPAMLRLEGARRYDALRGARGDGIPITTDGVGRFRQAIEPSDVAFIQAMVGKPMRSFGYDLEHTALSGGERIGFVVVDLPVGIAQVGSVRTIARIRSRRGRRGLQREEAA
jgi:hypothetical protein